MTNALILLLLFLSRISGFGLERAEARNQERPIPQPPIVQEPVFRKDTFNIRQYGAKGDGLTLNTQAIARAIEACHQAGGGVVLIPPGCWLTGPIGLKSNVNLHAQKGALVLFSDSFEAYPLVRTTYEGLTAVRCQAPVYGSGLENIALTVEGIFDGSGDAWRPVKKIKMTTGQWDKLLASGGVLTEDRNTWYPSGKALKGSLTANPGVLSEGKTEKDYEGIKDFLRPNMVSLTNCKKVLLEGLTFQNSPAWCLHPLLSEHVTLRRLNVRNPWYAQNGDGVDLESCSYALIEDCTFDVGDDAICIKSGRDEEGRKRGVPTEHVLVRNCVVHHGHGGFVIGSEMSGGVRDLEVTNCTFIGTDVGLRFKTTRGRGGVVEDIRISDIAMADIAGAAILFDMYYSAKDPVPLPGEKEETIRADLQPVTEATPQFRNFRLRNVVCNGADKGIFIRGLPEMNVKDIHLENISLRAKEGMTCIEGDNIHLKNVTLITPDPTAIRLQNSRNLTFDGIHYQIGTQELMHISGERSSDIRLLNTSVTKTKKEISFSNQATARSIRVQ
jgi:DNA sulfur modification protein DndE